MTKQSKDTKVWNRVFNRFSEGDYLVSRYFPEVVYKVIKVTKEEIYLKTEGKNYTNWEWHVPHRKEHMIYLSLRHANAEERHKAGLE